jgi:hypothetical protein
MTTPASPYATTPKPPLTPALKGAARTAGMVGFLLLTIGWGLLALAVGVALFSAFFAFILGLVGRSASARDGGYFRAVEWLDSLNVQAWVLPLVITGIVGLVLMVVALFVSAAILRRAGHPSPWGVTWAGAAVAIVGSWFVSWIAWLPTQLIALVPDLTAGIVTGIVSAVLQLAIVLVVGWLSWWWMAHVLRPRAASDVVPAE